MVTFSKYVSHTSYYRILIIVPQIRREFGVIHEYKFNSNISFYDKIRWGTNIYNTKSSKIKKHPWATTHLHCNRNHTPYLHFSVSRALLSFIVIINHNQRCRTKQNESRMPSYGSNTGSRSENFIKENCTSIHFSSQTELTNYHPKLWVKVRKNFFHWNSKVPQKNTEPSKNL